MRKSPDDFIVIPETGCWEWQLCITGAGYGKFSVKGVSILAHRHYYEMLIGPIPEDMVIDHLCRNRKCCNPEHLELVPHRENARRGAGTKLSRENVEEIRRLSGQFTQTALAKKFGVGQSQINRIIHGQRWVD